MMMMVMVMDRELIRVDGEVGGVDGRGRSQWWRWRRTIAVELQRRRLS